MSSGSRPERRREADWGDPHRNSSKAVSKLSSAGSVPLSFVFDKFTRISAGKAAKISPGSVPVWQTADVKFARLARRLILIRRSATSQAMSGDEFASLIASTTTRATRAPRATPPARSSALLATGESLAHQAQEHRRGSSVKRISPNRFGLPRPPRRRRPVVVGGDAEDAAPLLSVVLSRGIESADRSSASLTMLGWRSSRSSRSERGGCGGEEEAEG